MSVKRLAIPLCAVLSLLAIAGLLEVFVYVFSSSSEAVASEGEPVFEGPPVVAHVESSVTAAQIAERIRQREIVAPARSLVVSSSIVVDGAPLDQGHAEALVESARSYTAQVKHIDQRPILPSGCELVSLAVALNAEGVEVAAGDFVKHLRTGGNFAADYLGDPMKNGGGLPACIVDAANAWAAEEGAAARALNLTGTKFDGVASLVKLGYPVLVWTTERLVEPRFVGSELNGMRWYYPEHCVVVYGVDGEDVLVSDSLEGLVRRNLAQFSHIYEACGNKAVFIEPAGYETRLE